MTRTPPLALRNVVHGRFRSLLAIAGVGFSVTLVLLQLGFLEAVRITATTVFDELEFDIALLSPEYEQFFGPDGFPRLRLDEARSDPDVTSARPLYALMAFWRCPPYPVVSPRSTLSSLPSPSESATKAVPEPGAIERWWLRIEPAEAAPASRTPGPGHRS